MSLVTVDNLTKRYGDVTALNEVGFTADEREIVALVGPDGAGKTSLFRSMCGLIPFDSGKVIISGFDIATHFEQVKPLLGYMPQTFSLYPDLSVEENLWFYAGLFGLNRRRFETKAGSLYEFSGLGPFRRRRAGDLSGGMKQKLALSCALIHEPRVLILDEPTTGVDPLSRRQFWKILTSLRDDGSTIIVSTPYMDEVALSTRAIFIHEGRKLAEGTPVELAARYKGEVYRIQIEPTTDWMQRLLQIDGIDARRFGAAVHVYVEHGMSEESLMTRLENIGIGRELVEAVSPELEDAFIQLMGS